MFNLTWVHIITKSLQAPTQVSILWQLTQIQDPANIHQDRILPNGQAAVALWINDGLELEDEQYVPYYYSLFLL